MGLAALALALPTPRAMADAAAPAEIYDIFSVDQKPKPRKQSGLVYPRKPIEAGIAGTVFVEIVVGIDGKVRDAHVVRSTQKELESFAVENVEKWLFTPGEKNGKAVATRMIVPLKLSGNVKQ